MTITPKIVLGAIAALLLAGLIGLFLAVGGDVTAWLAALGSIVRYVGVLLLLVLIPVAIVGGAVWLAGRILHGTGSGEN